jgi:acid phosphatase (class A)
MIKQGLFAALAISALAAVASAQPVAVPAAAPIDLSAVIGPPPPKGSAQDKADRAIFKATRKLEGTPRWKMAVQDANLRMPAVANDTFSCSLGINITPEETPRLVALLGRAARIGGGAGSVPKEFYKRPRPMVEYPKAKVCAPLGDPKNWSYPSGHTALGWSMALVLAEIAPERAKDILDRGHAYGESRMVCGVHWSSDVSAGREAAAGALAIARNDPAFQADMTAARAEIAAARAKGSTPKRDCAADAAALATPIPR